MRFEDLSGKAVVIWGAGREGRAAHAELTRRGLAALIAVTDGGAVPAELRAVTATGADAVDRLESADVVLKSPGVPRTAPELRGLRERGIPITSLTDLWLSADPQRVIAVTGTKGKSTTSAAIHHLLDGLDVPTSLVGNGGTPVTVGDRSDARIAVAEVSSYQAADLTASPRVAVVTSLYPEHLPWHGSYEQYVADKLNLVAHGPDVVVVPDLAGELAEQVRKRVGLATRLLTPEQIGLAPTSDDGLGWHGVGDLGRAEIGLRGRHNLTNLALALAAVAAFLESDRGQRAAMLAAVPSFAALAHRLETVPSSDGRIWVDDSLATAPEAVVAALEAYPDVPVTLIVGGADRGLSFAPLAGYLAERDPAIAAIAVGPAGARLVQESGTVLRALRLAPDFATALAWARQIAAPGGIILLSPGAPSFDEFASFEERSAAFRAAATARE